MGKECFETKYAFLINGSISFSFPGITPPQKPQFVCNFPLLACSFLSNADTVVVTGDELRGMSTNVVTPPAIAAFVAVSNPSHSVRPGSFICTCGSTMPGIITWSPKSITVHPTSGILKVTSSILPLVIITAAFLTPSEVLPCYYE